VARLRAAPAALRKEILRGLCCERVFLQIKSERAKMANQDIGSKAGESSPQNKGVHSEREDRRSTSEDMKSTMTAVARDYTDKTSKELDEAKKRVRTLREDGEDYVRKNPTKAVFTALGVGFMLGVIFKR
jgi:ElaB/YqjD/DUF883 family membrane-anchored ribosome-binding protein